MNGGERGRRLPSFVSSETFRFSVASILVASCPTLSTQDLVFHLEVLNIEFVGPIACLWLWPTAARTTATGFS
jgi:hypothetical protein